MEGNVITIVGSYNVGLFLRGQRLPVLGETVLADEFIEGGGGKGSNQAVAAAKFGAAIRFICRLGADKYGLDALSMYARFGIRADMIKIDTTIHSGISVILIGKDGNNLISVAPGANLNLSPEDIDSSAAVLGNSRVVGFQLENRHETVFYAIRTVHGMGVTTFLDPAPAVRLPDDLYRCIDIIKPNETEASILTGLRVVDADSAVRAGLWLVDRGVRTAIVTLGEQGVVLVTRETQEHFPAPRVTAIDATGAGDVFSGVFLVSLAQDRSMPDAIRFASAAAALSTTRLGVIEAIPELAEVTEFMTRGADRTAGAS
ncbi:MAG: ribokinase [Spirochaetes bacterium]|nr:ribokinase [Spirochaetota bacterium]